MSSALMKAESFAAGKWLAPGSNAQQLVSAIDGSPVAFAGHDGLDFQAMLDHSRALGGPNLRAMGFHDRAKMLKALAQYLMERKEQLYDISYHSGATRADSWIDIEGGIGTLFAFASKGRRELPDGDTLLDGDVEMLSRDGSFVGHHICTPKLGVAVHINAFNFPVWGMLEKLSASLLAGVPAIIKPATATCYITAACFGLMIKSKILPQGAVQLICGSTGDLLDRLTAQDVVSFTGSAKTALHLRSNGNLLENAIPFIAEQDSLNASVLGGDAAPGSPEFDLFVTEVVREMTTKAGQKCTAIRRLMVPEHLLDETTDAIAHRLAQTAIGDPREKETKMGALVSLAQRDDVAAVNAALSKEAKPVAIAQAAGLKTVDTKRGAFIAPTLMRCDAPDEARDVHRLEAFGPTSTIMPYRSTDHACDLLNRGGGSLVASVFTHDGDLARAIAVGSAAWHGRLYVNNRDSQAAATGHGSPMPTMVHGGPGRAGGGEELGGIRSVKHYMQRTAIQGSPQIIAAMGQTWIPGAAVHEEDDHPFTRTFNQLQLGETLRSPARQITMEDIEHFAHFTGDLFYAHMDEEAARANPFFPGRVAHGYLLLSFAAGLFVQPDPGPVLANTGLTDLAFMKPVSADDSIRVELTVKRKTRRTDEYGKVRWHVALFNQDDEPVATYTLHTMNAY